MVEQTLNSTICCLGPCRFPSPLIGRSLGREHTPRFIRDDERILVDDRVRKVAEAGDLGRAASLELAGPRQRLFFDPAQTRIGIVTCGGLCPGLNDVIRGLVMEAHYGYGVREIYGFRWGYFGLISDDPADCLSLDPELVSDIHENGGTILGSSRGPQSVAEIVDRLQARGINVLFTIGGDGTLRGASEIVDEIRRRDAAIAVVGVPKTIDNDIHYIDQSFGFETAAAEAVNAILAAHQEARGVFNGVGLVKVMGRHSGFLACHAALATSHVNFVIIPEMPIGPGFAQGFGRALRERLDRRRHAVVLVAEGAGQDQLQREGQVVRDASGNVKLKDIGPYLAERIEEHLTNAGVPFALKYIDPSYMVRAVPAVPADSVYCWRLAQNAVHAAMAGKTQMLVGQWHGRLVHVPIPMAISQRKSVDPTSDLWLSVLETTGQPAVFE